MKRILLICIITTICFGLCSAVRANPTLTLTGSSQSGSPAVVEKKDDSDFFIKEWLYWLLDDVFGWDQKSGKKRYYTGAGSSGSDPGDSSGDSGYSDSVWDFDSGFGYDLDFDYGDEGSGGNSGSNGSDYNPGDDWGFDPGNDGWNDIGTGDNGWNPDPGAGWDRPDSGVSPPQTIPAPGALVLGGIGSALVNWLRRRKSL